MAIDVSGDASLASSVTLVSPASPKVGAVLEATCEQMLEDPRVSASSNSDNIVKNAHLTELAQTRRLTEHASLDET